jgi:hypothetical protein
VSQGYDDHDSSELMEWRVGVPFAVASLLIGVRMVQNVFSKSPWDLDRVFRLSIASAFLMLILWHWRIIRKDLKTFNRLCGTDGKLGNDALASQNLRRLVAGIVSLYSYAIIFILSALLALWRA